MSGFKLQGSAELDRKLQELGAAVAKKATRQAAREALQIAKSAAQASAPIGSAPHRTYKGRLVAPGFASRHIKVATKVPRPGLAIASLGVESEAFYALQFIELGTAKIPARPWLRPAFERSIPAMIKKFGESLAAKIEKVARGGKLR